VIPLVAHWTSNATAGEILLVQSDVSSVDLRKILSSYFSSTERLGTRLYRHSARTEGTAHKKQDRNNNTIPVTLRYPITVFPLNNLFNLKLIAEC
jgi:hypothetical protein